MNIEIPPEKKRQLRNALQSLYSQDFDTSLSDFQADIILDSVIAAAGPAIYNQAVQDVRAYMQSRLDDLDGEVYAVER